MLAEMGVVRQFVDRMGRGRQHQLLLLVPLLAMVVALLDLALILAIARLLEVLTSARALPVQGAALRVIGLAWLLALSRTLARRLQFGVAAGVWADLSACVLRALLHKPYGFFLQQSRLQLAAKLQEELPELAPLLVNQLVLLVANGCTVAMLTVGLCWLAGWSALALMVFLVLAYGGLALWIRAPLRRWQHRRLEAEAGLRELIHGVLLLLRELRLRGVLDGVLQQQQRWNQQLAGAMVTGEAMPERPRLLIEPLGLTAVLLLLLLPQVRSSGSSSLPWLALITLGLIRLAQPLQELWRALNVLHMLEPRLRHLLALIEAEGEAEPPQALPWPALAEQCALEEVWFRYSEERGWVLRNFSLCLPAGHTVGLDGPSGAGKSTAAAVLLGLLEPQRGQVVVDGRRLTRANAAGWQRQCAEVAQPVHLLNGTVAENLALYGPQLPEDQLWRVLEQVGLAQVVAALPGKLHTPIGLDGERLSGGQRQRLALARALLLRPRLLVLDEATNALDPGSEDTVVRCLQALRSANQPPVTVLVIAHGGRLLGCCDVVHTIGS